VRFVDDDQIPLDRLDLGCPAAGKVHRADHDTVLHERAGVAVAGDLAAGLGVEDDGRQMEFVLKLQGPLLADGGRGDDQNPPSAFGPVLADGQSRLDGLAQTDLIGQENAFGDRRAHGEQSGFDLVRVQVYTGIEERLGQSFHPFAALTTQLVGKEPGMVWSRHPASLPM